MADKDDITSGKQIVSTLSRNSHESQLHPITLLERTQAPIVSIAGNDDLLAELDALVAQARVEPTDMLTVSKVQRFLDQMSEYSGKAQQVAFDALRVLIGALSEDERHQLNLYPFFNAPDQPKQIERFLASCPAPAGTYVFQPLSFADLLIQPPKQWLVNQVLGAGDIGMIFGPPSSGKSFMVIDMIFAACHGKQWALRFDISRALSVAYCAGEGIDGLRQRFTAAAQHHGVKDLPNFAFFSNVPQLFTPERDGSNTMAETIGCFVREWEQRQKDGTAGALDLLIIDTLHSATVRADENSAQDMGQMLTAVKAASKALGCAVILVHHSNKAGSSERGSSAMRGSMDFMIEVKPTAGKVSIECAKLKDAPSWKPQTFNLTELGDSVHVSWDEPSAIPDSPGKQSAVLLAILQQNPNRSFTAKQLSELVGAGQSATNNALKRLADRGQVRCSLLVEDKKASNKNPLTFSIVSAK